jgi:hypothetical protein
VKVTRRGSQGIQVPRGTDEGEPFDDYYCVGTIPLAPHAFGTEYLTRDGIEYAVCSVCKHQVALGGRT